MYSLKDDIENMFLNSPDKIWAKRKLNEIYNRFGENRLDIENKTTNAEYFEYIMASAYEKEVLEERRQARMKNNMTQRREQQQEDVVEEKNELSPIEQIKQVTEDKELAEKQKRQTNEDADVLKKIREQSEEQQMSSVQSSGEEKSDLSIDIEMKMNLLLENSKAHLKSKDAEDMIEHIYLDIYGNLTIGAGKVINDEKTFMSVNFMVNGRPATMAEKKKAYQDFQKMKERGEYGSGYRANKYENKSPLRVNKQTMEDLLDKHVRNDIKRLRQGMPEFDGLPLALQEVLVDIRYNSGAITEEAWPNLRKAIREKNLAKIMANIQRGVSHKDRQKWAQDKIRSIKDWGYWED